MANFVTNIVHFEGDPERILDLRGAVQDDQYGMSGIDFNKIIPMPSGLWMGGINPDTKFRFGKNNWLDWSLANWGTKWNALRFDDDDQYSDTKITFVTADGTPAPIMQKLSEMYPEITMHHFWAEDNVGHNCGERSYRAGSVIEEFKPEPGVQAVDYACKIMGTTPADHCLKLNEDGTEYVCAEEENEEETMEEGMQL